MDTLLGEHNARQKVCASTPQRHPTGPSRRTRPTRRDGFGIESRPINLIATQSIPSEIATVPVPLTTPEGLEG
ncbi:hypothetical protein [Nocardia farcinica]|uniref:hypothetical protein n=1 Tax=Nocardia farcinica TaxID=37329 RepID=UPI0024551EAA|nr:hypothetical protein [Nocardia farcinica]